MSTRTRRRQCACGKPKDEAGRCTAIPSCSDFVRPSRIGVAANQLARKRTSEAAWIGLPGERVAAAAAAVNPREGKRQGEARERALRGWQGERRERRRA